MDKAQAELQKFLDEEIKNFNKIDRNALETMELESEELKKFRHYINNVNSKVRLSKKAIKIALYFFR